MSDEPEEYEPELGQGIFGCPAREYSCPSYIEAGLRLLADEIERVEWNNNQEVFNAPTGNNGTGYETDVFKMYAYYWGEDEVLEQRPNFKCDDLEISWYKYLGRGMSMNKRIDANDFFKIVNRCMESVREREKGLHDE